MTQRWYVRAALAAALGTGAAAGLARAQGPAPPPANPVPWATIEYGPTGLPPDAVPSGPPVMMTAPGVPFEYAPADGAPAAAPSRPVRDFIHSKPIRTGATAVYKELTKECDCWSHHNAYSCSSFRSEYTFIFGSCRDFFGEPCLPSRPPTPVPDAFGPANIGPWAQPGAGPGSPPFSAGSAQGQYGVGGAQGQYGYPYPYAPPVKTGCPNCQ